jgi:uncharacterized protein (TIGR00251 family)
MLYIIDGATERLAVAGKNIRLSVKVLPNARKQEIQRISEGEYKIHVLSPPIEGKANKEVIHVVASHFSLPSSRVRIARGRKSRKKIVVLEYES